MLSSGGGGRSSGQDGEVDGGRDGGTGALKPLNVLHLSQQ